jgi:hypothetical protein
MTEPDGPRDADAPTADAPSADAPVDPHAASEPATSVSSSVDPSAPLSELASAPNPDLGGALRDAVGAPTEARRARQARDEDHDYEAPRPSSRRRTYAIAAGVMVLAIGVATLAFLGVANSSRYLLVCGVDRVAAEQGRGFPPWGTHSLTGNEWKPITLPVAAECKPRETDDIHELEGWYLDALVQRASATLARRDLLEASVPRGADGAASPLDTAAAQLAQALLLARTPDRRDQRTELEQLDGDVGYWRAMQRLRDGTSALAEAAKQLDEAAARHPRHATDAAAWASFVRQLGDELRAGPGATTTPKTPNATSTNVNATAPVAPPHPTAPQGSALPVEPPPDNTPPPIDAGVPSGGVLL